ncbi:unnamed protein product [Schistosoma mattheei]|uniref:Uncharacterized protein n=1 Tax=Schistosoma mattheei TaxID=31246 RepID=A0A183PL95_9TREM|nr:unnamed protein product [Schistosoma mattheei]
MLNHITGPISKVISFSITIIYDAIASPYPVPTFFLTTNP